MVVMQNNTFLREKINKVSFKKKKLYIFLNVIISAGFNYRIFSIQRNHSWLIVKLSPGMQMYKLLNSLYPTNDFLPTGIFKYKSILTAWDKIILWRDIYFPWFYTVFSVWHIYHEAHDILLNE